jgi:hypothetical protein
LGSGSGGTEQRVSLVYCNSQVEVVPQTFLTFPGQTDVGISDTLHLGIGFFGHPHAAPACPALRLGLTTTRVVQARSLSMFCLPHRRI